MIELWVADTHATLQLCVRVWCGVLKEFAAETARCEAAKARMLGAWANSMSMTVQLCVRVWRDFVKRCSTLTIDSQQRVTRLALRRHWNSWRSILERSERRRLSEVRRRAIDWHGRSLIRVT